MDKPDIQWGGGERLTGAEPLVPQTGTSWPLKKILKTDACAEMSGIPRPNSLHKLKGKNSSDQVKDANPLEQAPILVVEVLDPEEVGHGLLLVVWARKEVREAAAGEARRDLWQIARRSANGSDQGT
jgi:hypothetical protein